MSKSRGNVVEPETVVEKYGVDTLRLFILFASPPEKDLEWSDQGIEGCWRFLNRVWRLVSQVIGKELQSSRDKPEVEQLQQFTHLTIEKVTDDIDRRLQFNTAIAAIMELVNFLYQYPYLGDETSRETVKKIILLLNPFVPHLASELWEKLNEKNIEQTHWPEYEAKFLSKKEIEIGIQVNGKLRARIKVDTLLTEQEVKDRVLKEPKIQSYLSSKKIKQTFYVPQKLVNIVTE